MKRSRYSKEDHRDHRDHRDHLRERSDVAEVASMSRTYFRTIIIVAILMFMLGVRLSDYMPTMFGQVKPDAEPFPAATPERAEPFPAATPEGIESSTEPL